MRRPPRPRGLFRLECPRCGRGFIPVPGEPKAQRLAGRKCPDPSCNGVIALRR